MTNAVMEPTLVLNRNWSAQNAVPVHKAVTKVMSGRAVILDPETYQTHDMDSWMALSPGSDHRVIRMNGGLDIRLPEIIICTKYDRFSRRKVKYCRRNLYKRDGGYCQYCGRFVSTRDFTVDHVVPRAMGGKSCFDNAVIACVRCNHHKAARTPEQAGMRLRRTWKDKEGILQSEFYDRPTAPQWSPKYAATRIKSFPTSWKQFLQMKDDEMYWNVELQA